MRVLNFWKTVREISKTLEMYVSSKLLEICWRNSKLLEICQRNLSVREISKTLEICHQVLTFWKTVD